MARIDIKTAQAETTAGTWHELENVTGPFGVIPIATAVQLCIGYTTPSLALATTISVGSAFKRQVAPSGPIYIQTASTSTVSWYSALINSAAVSYSAYAILSFEPALVFDFKGDYFRKSATASTFGASITHTRASSATMMNSSGTLVTVGNNVPRTGHHVYNGSAWVNEGILHESEARTNLMTSSGDLTGADWEWSGGLLVGTVTTGSPFGTHQTISPRSNSNGEGPAQRYQVGKTLTSGATYIGYSLVKYSAGSGWFKINMYNTGGTNKKAYFDLQNGVVGFKNSLIIDHGMVDYGDGWWLCWASANATSTSGGMSLEMPNADGVVACSAADVILIAGSQFELGSAPSSYIPTNAGATVTRAAETLTVPAANLPYDNTNVSIQMDGKMTYADTDVAVEVSPYRWRRDSLNYIQPQLNTQSSRTGQMQFYQRQSTSGQDAVFSGNSSYSPDTNVPFNLASRHGSTFINGAHNGTLLTANTTPTALPDLSATDLELGYVFMGTIGLWRMWSDDLGDVGITEAST